VCIALCTIVAHNIAQNRPNSFPPYPPDNHHISDDVYLREGHIMCQSMVNIQFPTAEIRRGKKRRRKKKKKEERRKKQDENIMVCPITYGDHNKKFTLVLDLHTSIMQDKF